MVVRSLLSAQHQSCHLPLSTLLRSGPHSFSCASSQSFPARPNSNSQQTQPHHHGKTQEFVCSQDQERTTKSLLPPQQSTASRRRLIRDFKRLSSDPPGGISGAPCPDNIMIWNAVIFGPGLSLANLLEWFIFYCLIRTHG